MATKSDGLVTAGIAAQSGTRADQLVFTLPIPINRSFIDTGSFETWATQNGWGGGTTAQAAAFLGDVINNYINTARASSIAIALNQANTAALQAAVIAQVN